jgi:hypothetical protein
MTVQGRMAFPPAASDKAQRDSMQWPAAADSTRDGPLPRPALSGICVDPDKTGDDLVRLVLVLMETIRQLVERQAIRRVDSGSLSEDEVERLGLALLRLEERMTGLKEHFGLSDDDLALRVGLFHELVDDVRRE